MNRENWLKNIEGAVFDLDGTLLDSSWVWEKVDEKFLGDRGFQVPDDYVDEISPLGAERAAIYTIERFGLNEDKDDIVREWIEMAKKENTQSCFQRGLISLLILALLDQEDMYGYQIVQEITERSGGAIVTEEGSLYPVLYKLQDQGMLSGEKVLVGKRMRRLYCFPTKSQTDIST